MEVSMMTFYQSRYAHGGDLHEKYHSRPEMEDDIDALADIGCLDVEDTDFEGVE